MDRELINSFQLQVNCADDRILNAVHEGDREKAVREMMYRGGLIHGFVVAGGDRKVLNYIHWDPAECHKVNPDY